MTESDDLKRRINELLGRWSKGDAEALNELVPLVYHDLRRIAGYLFKSERKNHTLQPTAVLNEAFMKLGRSDKVECRDGAHFLSIYARAMRQILIDYARLHNRKKREVETVPLDDVQLLCRERHRDLLALEEALDRLARANPRQASVVDLRIFCGFNNKEVAEILKIAENTVIRDWNFASGWLRDEMKDSRKWKESASVE
jgi:RNA polymerase sigma factor (TIGR02999 family)